MLLAACEHNEFEVPPAAPPRACEDLARTVGQPSFRDDENPYLIAKKYKTKLGQANNNLHETAKCQRDVREGSGGN